VHVLLSNDDGLFAEGLQLLRRELSQVPQLRITTVAPDREQSAQSHALTLSNPLRVQEHEGNQFSVSGTPTDCVLVALKGLLQSDRPDVVISGINHGPNMGEDVHYSGTVAAAFEGMLLGLPAIAISLASKQQPRDFSGAAFFLREVLVPWLFAGAANGALLNINVPALAPQELRGVRFCRLGSRKYDDVIIRKEDPRGRAYYWIGGDSSHFADLPESDFAWCAKGWVTVTPLHPDLTDDTALKRLSVWGTAWRD
jgi:5'-nucleotidase